MDPPHAHRPGGETSAHHFRLTSQVTISKILCSVVDPVPQGSRTFSRIVCTDLDPCHIGEYEYLENFLQLQR